MVLIKEDIKSQSLTDWRFGNKLEVLKENGGKVQGTKLQILSKSGNSTTCHQSLQKIKTLVVVVTEQKNEFMIMVKRIEKEENQPEKVAINGHEIIQLQSKYCCQFKKGENVRNSTMECLIFHKTPHSVNLRCSSMLIQVSDDEAFAE